MGFKYTKLTPNLEGVERLLRKLTRMKIAVVIFHKLLSNLLTWFYPKLFLLDRQKH